MKCSHRGFERLREVQAEADRESIMKSQPKASSSREQRLQEVLVDPNRLGSRGIGVHSLRKMAINDVLRNPAQMHEAREFAGHSDIRTTELSFVRKGEDAEMAARRIQIRVPTRHNT
ncbi:MAG TPA: hypothetical protein VKU02_27610 [Gemmataceae bacterium]|nr:hypothetical protein [Gemmataceae bacterium]